MTTVLALAALNAENFESGNAGDGQVLTADGAGGAAWMAAAGGGPGYLEYVALLTQAGENAPVATVLKNTLGGTVVWTRVTSGQYSGTLVGAFPSDKVFCVPFVCRVQLENNLITYGVHPNSNDAIAVSVYNVDEPGYVDSQLSAHPIEVRVYP